MFGRVAGSRLDRGRSGRLGRKRQAATGPPATSSGRAHSAAEDLQTVERAAQHDHELGGVFTGGFEPTFAVNVLANYLLIRLLADRFTAPARIVITSSDTHAGAGAPLVPVRHGPAPRR